CSANQEIRARLDPEVVLDIHHDEFLAEPAEHLEQLCRFLGLETDPDYVAACCSIMYATPHRSRHRAPWTSSLIEGVEKRMARYDFLGGYGYDD
ncbi:MAG: sulfotransferase, partial [Actinomycetota bacterium]